MPDRPEGSTCPDTNHHNLVPTRPNEINRLLDLVQSYAARSPGPADDSLTMEDQAMMANPNGTRCESEKLATGQEAVDWFRQQIDAVTEQIKAVSHELVSGGNETDVMCNPDHEVGSRAEDVLVRAHQHEIQAQSVTLSRQQLHTVQTYRATRGTKPSTWYLRQPKVWAARDHERLGPAVTLAPCVLAS
eukprot:TRINITY_DN1224_c0_g1_i4.p1 TRINITY_DN1224_c0_g1~~TRINITY_DN1224_c0_g1_i4.p1  ORF type:complete len:189 (+),score=22.56 TRINITY_DN1224_c0_g1_i4:202-768(+)